MKQTACAIFRAGVLAVDAGEALKTELKRKGDRLFVGPHTYDPSLFQRVFVVGAGKASGPMAAALEEIILDRISAGFVNVKYGHLVSTRKIVLHEAGHPIPDKNGLKGAKAIADILKEASRDDLVICLFSGGGSALLALPVEGISLEEKQVTTGLLLRSGAAIDEINIVRKHLSGIKGGQMAQLAAPATVLSFFISDVVGDDLESIASGPTVPDSSTFQQAVSIVKRYGIEADIPAKVMEHLLAGEREELTETAKPRDLCFSNVRNFIIANNSNALEAAARKAEEEGFTPLILTSFLQGEAREVARVVAALCREFYTFKRPIAPPVCLLMGGETTVTVRGKGKGGRNQELALSAALDIQGMKDVTILSGGTDGTDGPTDAAGAVVDGMTVARARGLGLEPRSFLNENDAYNLFKTTGDLLMTGPTGTNVMDLIVALIA